MCCCDSENLCIENTQLSRRWVAFWSFMTLLSSGAVMAFAILMHKSGVIAKIEPEVEYLRVDQVHEYLFTGLMTMAVFTAIFSCFGFTFKWMRNRCCTVIYGTLIFPVWLISLVVGLTAMAIAHSVVDEFTKECNTRRSKLYD